MLVVDTSAVLDVLTSSHPAAGLLERLAGDGDLHAPHLIDTEMLHALRGLSARDELSEERATDALTDFADLPIVRYAHQGLSARVWELRHNLTAYDATFVALAEVLAVPLVTCDARLAGASSHQAEIELFEPAG